LSKVELEIGSFEEDAIDAEPTGPTEPRVGVSDQSIVQEGIGLVPTLSQGAIDELLPSSSFFFSNTSPAGIIRTAQRTTGAFVRYNPDKTVDYVEFPTGSAPVATIGPDEGNVEGAFDVKENEREEFTHLTVLGASEGDTQISATGVVSNFSGGRERHRQFVDKSITNETRAQQLLDRYLEEYENDPVRIMVETTVFGEQLEVGSVARAISTDDDLDANLFVIENKRILQGNQDVYEVRLSNRLLTEENDDAKQRLDIETFNKGFQGDVVTINSGGYRAPVDSGSPYRLSVRVPDDVVGELTAEVEVEGLPYRAYSSGAAAGGGDHSHNVDIDIPNHSHNVNINIPNHVHDIDINETSADNTEFSNIVYTQEQANNVNNVNRFSPREAIRFNTPTFQENSFATLDVRATRTDRSPVGGIVGFSLFSDATGKYYPDQDGQNVFLPLLDYDVSFTNPFYSTGSTTILVNEDISGDDVRLAAKANLSGIDINVIATLTMAGQHTHDIDINQTTQNGGFFSVTDTTQNGGSFQQVSTTEQTNESEHEHPPDPGITRFPQNTPSDVEISVNGNTVQTNIGSGVFTETVDIGGQLQTGFNDIELTSNSLGHLRATAFLDVYRQITQ